MVEVPLSVGAPFRPGTFYSPPLAKCCTLFCITSIHSILPNAAEENGMLCPLSGSIPGAQDGQPGNKSVRALV